MGRKPVLTLAGTLVTSLALAGCQSSSSARPSSQFTSPGGPAVSQNKTTTTTTGGAAVTYNGQPGAQGTSAVQLNGGISQTSTTGQSSNPLGTANQTGRLTSTTSGGVVIPPNPTPAPGQSPSTGLQPLPSASSTLNMNMAPPPVGMIGPTGSPLSASGSVSLNSTIDVPGPPAPRQTNSTSYPVLLPNPTGNGGPLAPLQQN